MDIRSLAVGLILFGVLAIGCTIDGARRKAMAQPLWLAQSWRSYLKGLIVWLVIGVVAVLVGIVGVLV